MPAAASPQARGNAPRRAFVSAAAKAALAAGRAGWRALGWATLFGSGCACAATAASPAPPPSPEGASRATALNARLGRGMNLGNALEAPREGEWGVTLQPEYFALIPEAIGAIRQTNPDRAILVGPAEWNSVRALEGLVLPAQEQDLIVTFHYYEPFRFTNQGAEWVPGSSAWLGTKWQGMPRERRAIEQDLDLAARWARKNGRPLFLGEFGAYRKAELASRAAWTAYVERQAEQRGISWAYWEFCAGFGAYDRSRGAWNQELLRALIP